MKPGPEFLLLLLAFAAVAFLYATVGHGGATGYLAVAALAGFSPRDLRGLILVCNLLVAGNAWFQFHRAGYFDPRKLFPLVLASVPAAYLGARMLVETRILSLLLGIVLLSAAFRFLTLGVYLAPRPFATSKALFLVLPLVGCGLGFLAGLTGIGGGIFLSSLLLGLGWADAKRTAALSAGFIVLNSGAALIALGTGGFPGLDFSAAIAGSALLGGLAGARWGAEKLSHLSLQRALGLVLLTASLRTMMRGFT